jgi:hypothetical protein
LTHSIKATPENVLQGRLQLITGQELNQMEHIFLRHKVQSSELRSLKVEIAVETVFDKVSFLANLLNNVWYLLALEKLSDLGLL